MTDNKQPTEEMVDVITLEFDDGDVIECEIIGVFEYNRKDYIE